jgi:hypothetical protein
MIMINKLKGIRVIKFISLCYDFYLFFDFI